MTPEDRIKKLGSVDDATPTETEWSAFKTQAHRTVMRRRVAGALGGVGVLLVVAFGFYVLADTLGDRPDGPVIGGSPTPGPTTEEPSPSASPSSEEPNETEPETTILQQWFVEDEKLMLAHGRFEKSQTPARDAIESLIGGVPGPLGEDGVETAIPEGVELTDISISDGTASVVLDHDFSSASSTQALFAHGQIVYTLTQFPTVDQVSISWRVPGPIAAEPEGRKTYEDLLPPIVVEQPFAGEVLGTPFTLSGIANVFEATVSYRLVDEKGNVLDEGFTTATCGTGCWGTFEEKVEYDGKKQWVELQVFQSSAEDGSPMNMVRVPLNFEKAR